MDRTISDAGLDLIQRFEGLRLNAYKDAVGVWTIGWGHTLTARPGMRITRDQALALLIGDLSRFESCVNTAVDVPLTQHAFDALVSFAFNVGCGALLRSTLLRLLNAGDHAGAAAQFARWNKAGGRELVGLTRRRAAERALFESPDQGKPDENAAAHDPDGPEIDLPTLRAPWRDTAATRLLEYVSGLSLIEGHDTIEPFQQSLAVPADGIVGPHTWRAIVEIDP